MSEKYIYSFNEGSKEMRDLLGGKGANLAEMTRIGLPVPFGFTITTESCNRYYKENMTIAEDIIEGIYEKIEELENVTGKSFGSSENPLLVSVRSGAVISMPGMMDTILNLGLNDASVEGLAALTENRRFAMDSYRRFIQMFGDVVLEISKAEFDNVGLMINVEARGPWGPALLFEACPGNSKVIDLYASTSRYPYTYSLTTVVYNFMPNFTDFTIVKDSIPGLNFSTITDVNHYHTHLDNFSNISEKSIQHYGEQILPLAREYVKNQAYSDVEAMKASNDAVNFTVPGIGLLNFSKVGYVIVNSAIFLIFLLLFGLEGIRGRLKASKVFLKSVAVL